MLRNRFDRIAAYPLWMQTLLYLALYLAALIVLGLLVLFSPFVMISAGFALMAAIFALVVRSLRRGPLRSWGLVALTSLVLLFVFMGISNALYFSVQPEQASSSGPDERTLSTETIPPTRRSVTVPGVGLTEVKNGKIVRDWTYRDQLSLLAQLGITEQPGLFLSPEGF